MSGSYKSAAAGLQQSWMGFLDANGFLLGSDTSAPAAGATGSGMLRILGVKSANATVPERERTQSTSEDGELVYDFDFPSPNSRAFIIETALQDLAMEAKLIGKPVEAIAGGLMGYEDITNAPEYDTCIIIQSRSKKADSGVNGQKGWSGKYYPLATVQALGRSGYDERGAAVYRLSVTPQLAAKNNWGVTFRDANGVDFFARARPYSFSQPIYLHRYVGNGVLTTFNLDYAPIDVASISVYSSVGAALTVASVSASGKTFTLNSAPANNLDFVAMVQYQA